jgi:dihydrofolate reductase
LPGRTGYWPTATEEDTVIAKGMNSLPKIVFFRSLISVDRNNSRIVREIVPEEILKLKQQPGKDMVIYGSGSLVSEFAHQGLINEYRFIVNPVVLGAGKTLFKDFNDKFNLILLEARITGIRKCPAQLQARRNEIKPMMRGHARPAIF